MAVQFHDVNAQLLL